MNPLFSIVIANFNSGQYIEKAINSILNQSCRDYELIIVDGGSTDDSIEIIKKYADKLAWWVSEPDKGQSDAFNKGFAHATGRYYTWLNADDLLLPGVLENVKYFIERNDSLPWVAINTCYIDKEDTIISCSVCPDYSNKVLSHGYVTDIGPSSFFTADLFRECGPFDVSNHYTMDCDLWMKFVNKGYSYFRVPGWGWAFRVHELSKTSAGILGEPSEGQVLSQQKIISENNFEIHKSNIFYQKIKKALFCTVKRVMLNKKYSGMDIIQMEEQGAFK